MPSLSDPAGVTNAGGVWAAAPTGLMRLWKKNSSEARSVPDDLVTNGCYNATDLSGWDAGHRTVLYLEGVTGGAGELKVSMGPVGETGLPWKDAVMVTVAQISYTVDFICTNAIHASHTVQTHVIPTGLLDGTNVLYELQRYAGAQGAACFDGNGSNVQYVAGGAGQLVLRGLAFSDTLTNMVLKARVGNLESMSARFTVFDLTTLTAAEDNPHAGVPGQSPPMPGSTNVVYLGDYDSGFGFGLNLSMSGQPGPVWTPGFRYQMQTPNGIVADQDWFDATGPLQTSYVLMYGSGCNPSEREFTLTGWFDCDGNGLYTNTEPHRVIGVKVVEVVDLVLSNTASGVTVASTNRDGVATASNTLYLAEATNGMATMTLQSDWLPTNVPPGLLRWDIVDATNDAVAGAEWLPHAGSCSNTAVSVTWSNTGANAVREFKVRAWFDCDSNGQLSPDEPMRSAFVTVIKVELDVEKTTLTLMETNRLTAVVTPSNGVTVSQYTFEIKRDGGSTWDQLHQGPQLSFDAVARVAGNFDLRVSATVAGVQCVSQEKDVEAQFPSDSGILSGQGVQSCMDQAWTDTKNATTPTSRREEGYYITLDTSSGAYGITAHTIGTPVATNQGASWDTATYPRPPDSIANPTPLDQPTYTIGWFHTHTPTTYRSVGRGVGPSGADSGWSANANIRGFGVLCG